jgi:LacI family transcriptional regulator
MARRRVSAVTIHEVARQAGVSPMTVSRVVNGVVTVRPSTRGVVLRAIRELGYQPNLQARSLAGANATHLALIYSNPSASYMSELLVGALAQAAKRSAQFVLIRWDDGSGPRNWGKISKSIAGVILPPPLSETVAVVAQLAETGMPVISVAAARVDPRVSCVRIDDFGAAHEMGMHLISLGHQRIGFIKGNPNQAASQRRLDGFRQALQSAGLQLEADCVRQGYFTYRSGLEATESLLSQSHPPTAIFASNDDMAAAAISVAHRRGLDVPRDLSIVGFDDTHTATAVWPEITTIRQPIARMAEASVDLLIENLNARNSGSLPQFVDQVFPHDFMQRSSDAEPR